MFWESQTEQHLKEYQRATDKLTEYLRQLDEKIESCNYKIWELEKLNDNELMGRSPGIYGKAITAFYSKGEYICNRLRDNHGKLIEIRNEIAARIQQSGNAESYYSNKVEEEKKNKNEKVDKS